MRRIFQTASIALFVLALTGCSTIRKSNTFEKRSPQIFTVGIMPVEVQIQRIVFKGTDELLYQESKTASEQLTKELEMEMKNRGYDVKLLSMDSPELAKDPALKQEVSKLNEKYASLLADAQKQYVNKMKWKDFNLSFGSSVNQVADALDVDALIFATGSGFVKSGGEIGSDITKSVLIGVASLGNVIYVAPTSGGQIFVSMVDGDNGEMLWHNFSNPQIKLNLTEINQIHNAVRQVIKKYPVKAKTVITSVPAKTETPAVNTLPASAPQAV